MQPLLLTFEKVRHRKVCWVRRRWKLSDASVCPAGIYIICVIATELQGVEVGWAVVLQYAGCGHNTMSCVYYT